MKNKALILIIVIAALLDAHTGIHAQALHDSLDVLHYDLRARLGTPVPRQMTATAMADIVKMAETDTCTLELLSATDLHNVQVNGDTTGYSYDNARLRLPISNIAVGDTFRVSVQYSTWGYVESYGFGGLHMDNNIYYNLGAGILTDPHALGRAVLPCRDNFHDKATYHLDITTAPGWTSLCSGQLVERHENSDSTTTCVWELREPAPTYIVSLSAAPFSIMHYTIQGDTAARHAIGEEPGIPVTIGWQDNDSSTVARTFDIMNDVVPCLERHFGPYRWHTIGYIGTPRGSMEHANNIHLVSQCIANRSERCQSITIHEFAHSWFGNLVTCQTADDMWFNEGGASFCEEVGIESAFDKATASRYFKEKLDNTIRSAHVTDGGWHPLYAQTSRNVYGSTTYDKGACVWHSLRSYIGDSLFYASMARFFAHNAFGNIESHQFCDSLSAISGADLGEFFRFHVFTPGFTDFVLTDLVRTDSAGSSSLTFQPRFCQNTRGTQEKSYRNKIPVTFFSQELQSCKRLFTADWNAEGRTQDTHCVTTAVLPFCPAFCVVDMDKEYSYASISDTVRVRKKNTDYELPLCHFKAKAQTVDTATPTFLAVTHHYTKPTDADGSLGATPSIVRISDHYWTITGLLPDRTHMWGFFKYCKGTSPDGTDDYLDRDLLCAPRSADSLQLVYRATPHDVWRIASKRLDGTLSGGALIHTKLLPGEYALAIIDTARLGIAAPQHTDHTAAPSAMFYPNPGDGTVVIRTQNLPRSFMVTVCDTKGQQVFMKDNCHDGTMLRLSLPKGVYIATLHSAGTHDNGKLCSSQIVIN